MVQNQRKLGKKTVKGGNMVGFFIVVPALENLHRVPKLKWGEKPCIRWDTLSKKGRAVYQFLLRTPPYSGMECSGSFSPPISRISVAKNTFSGKGVF